MWVCSACEFSVTSLYYIALSFSSMHCSQGCQSGKRSLLAAADLCSAVSCWVSELNLCCDRNSLKMLFSGFHGDHWHCWRLFSLGADPSSYQSVAICLRLLYNIACFHVEQDYNLYICIYEWSISFKRNNMVVHNSGWE